VIDALATDLDLVPVRQARAQARAHAWRHGVRPSTSPSTSTPPWSPPTRRSRAPPGRTSAASASIRCSAAWTRPTRSWPGCCVPAMPAPTMPAITSGSSTPRSSSSRRGLRTIRRCWPARTPPAPPTTSSMPCVNAASSSPSASTSPSRFVMPCLRFLRMLGCPRSPRTAIHGTVPPSASCTISTSAPGPPPPGPSAGVSGPIPALSSPSPITTGFAFRCSSPTRRTPIWRPWRRVTVATPGSRTASAAARRRAAQPALPRLRRQRSLAGAGARRPGPGRLDAAPLPRRRGRPVGTEAPPLLPPPRRCPPGSERATALPAPAVPLAVDATAGLGLRAIAQPSRRLTPSPRHQPDLFGDPTQAADRAPRQR